MSNSIIFIIIILAVTWLVVYFYYHHNNKKKNNIVSINSSNLPIGNLSKPSKRKNKKVRFNKEVEYNIYKKIDVDDILSPKKNDVNLNNLEGNDIANHLNPKKPINKQVNRLQVFSDINNSPLPSNLEQNNVNEQWDANFGVPLYTKDEQKKFVHKMQRNMENYARSLGDMVQYQTDKNTIIKTDITIDPFASPITQKNNFQGRTIKEIYDEQVAGPRVVPKRIKKKTPTTIIYENESDMNGGMIDTNLYGFDGIKDEYKSASFGDEFNTDKFM